MSKSITFKEQGLLFDLRSHNEDLSDVTLDEVSLNNKPLVYQLITGTKESEKLEKFLILIYNFKQCLELIDLISDLSKPASDNEKPPLLRNSLMVNLTATYGKAFNQGKSTVLDSKAILTPSLLETHQQLINFRNNYTGHVGKDIDMQRSLLVYFPSSSHNSGLFTPSLLPVNINPLTYSSESLVDFRRLIEFLIEFCNKKSNAELRKVCRVHKISRNTRLV